MDFISREINGPRVLRYSSVANSPCKPLILLDGGPGRTETLD